ncbi:MAG: hypothetical protein IKP77_03320 [Acholeplasmatales bacterium]|nr:hypothetical protein [Acholeplasmatales bacterium]
MYLTLAIILTVISFILSIILIIFSYKKQDNEKLSYFPYDLIIRIVAALSFIAAIILYYFALK